MEIGDPAKAADEIIIINNSTGERFIAELKADYKLGHVVCTEQFPLTRTNQVEINIKSEKKLYEIDFFAKSNYRKMCKLNFY